MFSLHNISIVISENMQVVHKERTNEFIAIQHDLRLLCAELLLEMLLELDKEVVTL